MLLECLAVLLFIFVLLLVVLKYYFKAITRWNDSYTCLVGKTAIVTGANTGIGYFTALDFAKRGAKVILVCRNKLKAEEAKKIIISATGNHNVLVKLADLASLQAVRDVCKDINENEERLDILVNNAGVSGTRSKLTKDGLEITWQINHISHFLMTHLLLDKMRKTKSSRIVIVSSLMAKTSNLSMKIFEDSLFGKRKDKLISIYAMTKQANILFTRELCRRLKGSDPTVNALHPGAVSTDIWRHLPELVRKILKFVNKTPEEGAQTQIYCAVSKELENVSGKFFDECAQTNMYKSCSNVSLQKQLWKRCEEVVMLKESEIIKE